MVALYSLSLKLNRDRFGAFYQNKPLMKKFLVSFLACSMLFSVADLWGQRRKKASAGTAKEVSLDAFEFRNIGPAFLSGRISDIAVHPENDNVWYVAVASGGVWKTENAGTTWQSIFDGQSTFAAGSVTIDPSNPSTVWVGTGENVGGRHIAFGDGVYKSEDNGASWKNMGLPNSEHISTIIVHPTNSDIVWVAVQGPLWSEGGDRGLYKTTDGGNSWRKVLGEGPWTGATDLVIDPRNPEILYAATWDRHRTVAAYMGGGPGSGIHRSTDGGETWKKLTSGIPNSNLGKIGLAISPMKPDVVYAAIELDRRTGGVFRSTDRGSSWKKMSNTVSGGTGPHYYQELYASPHKFDRLYLMNVRVLTSEDGGATFTTLQESDKHSDNHAMVFKEDDPNYLMLGTDAGIYESFDLAETWKYHKNLPLTQYYKVAVNNAKPFYHVFGGTQDNGSSGGPSATDEREGIANKHWYKTLFADGHQSATDPENPNIIYAETQQGGLHRVDLTTGEPVLIQPQAREGEPHERYNWDAPILVSPHKASRLYFASYRVWKSEDRGDSWTPISGDLTRNEERIELPILGKQQSWDNPWDVFAMSNYNTITSLSESEAQEGLIWAGTDDGIIQFTTNGGESWTKIPVTQLGLPERAFVNDIKADLFDPNTVYVSLDNHKEGDYAPYLYVSNDQGKSWRSLGEGLGKRNLVWRMVQDYVKKELLFAATENGIFASMNAGASWQKMAGTPTISFRDITIQREENDLVAASFGRGFFVLDDYSPLRDFTTEKLAAPATLFAPRPAKWFVPRSNVGNTGADYYFAKNPTFGAVFTVHMNGDFKSIKAKRQAAEKKLAAKANVPFPGWDALDEELAENPAKLLLMIKDANGNLIRTVTAKPKKGSQRIAWDLRHANPYPVSNGNGGWRSGGPMATPGTYMASIALEKEGVITPLDGPVSFEVKPIREGVLKGMDYASFNSYFEEVKALLQEGAAYEDALDMNEKKLASFETALYRTNVDPSDILSQIAAAKDAARTLRKQLEGSPAKNEVGEKNPASWQDHLGVAMRGMGTTYGPTALHKQSLTIAKSMLDQMKGDIKAFTQQASQIEAALKAAGAPYIMGQGIH
ncbi:MAG: Dispase autolysis-inducing protein [SAR116 cluster bacterium]|nr:MAG: Dispase autolysis-inducing protein [SAR116 cluster bacterium]